MTLVLSLFPGIDLLGRGFEDEGFCVVRGPDIIYGGDIRDFTPPAGVFDGIIGGSPCQDFSSGNWTEGTGYSRSMLDQYARCVLAARPAWFVLENVPRVPDIDIEGYKVQRIDLKASEFGLRQFRVRHVQFGSTEGKRLIIPRVELDADLEPCCMATEGERPERRRGWAEFCELQGLERDFRLPGMTLKGKYRAVGNGVPLPMARAIAAAIREIDQRGGRVCLCGCGRPVYGKAKMAKDACRQRKRRGGSETRETISYSTSVTELL